MGLLNQTGRPMQNEEQDGVSRHLLTAMFLCESQLFGARGAEVGQYGSDEDVLNAVRELVQAAWSMHKFGEAKAEFSGDANRIIGQALANAAISTAKDR